MGSMHVGLDGHGKCPDDLIEFYVRRAKENIGLIVTGGAAVCQEGGFGKQFMSIYDDSDIHVWRKVTENVHLAGGRIALQLFHAGRYAYKSMTGFDPVAPSPRKSPINPDTPVELTPKRIEETIRYFAKSAIRAKKAGFDAVEIMGSEGYLINQFISPVTNIRTDDWGGSFKKRSKFAIKVAEAVRLAVGPDYPVIFRMSGIDLIENSTTEEETAMLAKLLEQAGVDALNIGIGWHESRVPTISMKVPRLKFIPVAAKVKQAVSIPVIGSNRINNPEDANNVIAEKQVDLVSLARPFLADPAFVTKALENKPEEINTCIACNQACLDHIFDGKSASCLVNPEAGRERTLILVKSSQKKKVVIIGAGPAGLEAARTAAKRGHDVTLVDDKTAIGGQLQYAKSVPGKSEFNETLRYYDIQLKKFSVRTLLNYRVTFDDPLLATADEIIVAAGITPRIPDIIGIDRSNVYSYRDVFEGFLPEKKSIVIIGGGGIACDLALYLKDKGNYQITMLQRGTVFARGIGKTTRWATLLELKKKGISMIGGVLYKEISDDGITYIKDDETHFLQADTIITASGQLPNDSLYVKLKQIYKHVHLIGGAKLANGLDAKRAILEGTLLGRKI